ncbi:lytic murein transglycosylase [Desulfovibrio cuneatus]|uniref:lytic murein transglycosylase n=1 Tax=Desulfovibrio cuneatus TaxID=159728 RepID=UPI000404E62F|nr:lytic murein transglycosylase [Desulfovibrio cuneatus]
MLASVWLLTRHNELRQKDALPKLVHKEKLPAAIAHPFFITELGVVPLCLPAALPPAPLALAQEEVSRMLPHTPYLDAMQRAARNEQPPLLPEQNEQNGQDGETPPEEAQPIQKGLDKRWLPLMQRLQADGFTEEYLQEAFAALGENAYSPAFMAAKVTELHGVYGIMPTAGQRLTPEGYTPPVERVSTSQCVQFLRTHEDFVATLQTQYGVPAHVIMAIMLIETGFGENLGAAPALQALASLASTTTQEALAQGGNARQARAVPERALERTLQNKSAWAYAEVKALLAHCQEAGIPPASIPGSMYGAVGLCQFMPSNIERYAVDGDANGQVNLFDPIDAMASIANFLAEHGWRGARTEDAKLAVLLHYNQDTLYARQVLAVAGHMQRALAGKKSPENPLAFAFGGVPSGARDPSLRRRGPIPRAGKVQGLGDYGDLLGM